MADRTTTIAGMLLLSAIIAGCAKSAEDKTEDSAKAMAGASGSAVAPAAAPADRQADAAAIVRADSAWLRLVMARNVDSLMTFYTPDAVSYTPGSPPATGTDQVRAAYTDFVKSTITNPKLNSNTVKFSDDGMMAYDYGTYTMTVAPPGGKTATENGAYLNVWRKVGGEWKLAAEMSTPVPAPKS